MEVGMDNTHDTYSTRLHSQVHRSSNYMSWSYKLMRIDIILYTRTIKYTPNAKVSDNIIYV